MKKNGFTLAEVLITLAIIGVVATMTLPALIANTGEQQAKTGLKKIVNTLSEAAQMHEAIGGFSFDNLRARTNLINAAAADDEQTMEALLRARTVIDFGMTQDGTAKYDMPEEVGKNLAATADTYVYLRDGSIIMYNSADTTTGTNITADGFAEGFLITVDTNGVKAPNALSNCKTGGADKAGADDYTTTDSNGTTTTASDPSVCKSKNDRAINDRFQVKLRGTKVEPVGAAAVWAFQS